MAIITITILLSNTGIAIFCIAMIPDLAAVEHYSWVIYLELSLICFGDVWLAIWLNYYVHKSRRTSRDSEATSILNTLLVYMVNTGSLCGIFAVMSLITYAALPNTFLDFAFLFVFTPLYSNALFATLNVRSWSHAGIDDAQVPIMTINGNPTIPVAFADAPPPEMHIHVDKEIVRTG